MAEDIGLGDGELWITRMAGDGNDHDVARIGYAENGARETFDHARRVLRRFGDPKQPQELEAGDLLVTLLHNGDCTEEDPLIVPSETADWFLDTWLQVPRAWRDDVAPAVTGPSHG